MNDTSSIITRIAVDWAPLIPWTMWGALAIVSALVVFFGLWRQARGGLWRVVPLGLLLLVLANPQVVRERQQPLPDVAVVVVDDSASQRLGQRPQQTEAALETLRKELDTLPNVTIRESHVGSALSQDAQGTRLISALQGASADIPPQRLAGAFLITDGEVHDVPQVTPGSLPFSAPVQVLLTGQHNETDRRLIIEKAPSFGLVGSSVPLDLRIEDQGIPDGTLIPVTLTESGGQGLGPQQRQVTVPSGKTTRLTLPIPQAGPVVVALSALARDGEPSLENNRAALTINGIRDRLRVLLISGKPHIGERSWRQLLKADPNVDLVHFTILRPPLKDDAVPLSELALIAFPMRELFQDKLDGFDLIVFDSYSRQGPVLSSYFGNIADYVKNGGALLVAAGPDFGGPASLVSTPLGDILPADPDWDPISREFRPQVSPLGSRHPITASLPGANHAASDGQPAQAATWGPWLRAVRATPTRGNILMTGPGDSPLVMVDRVGKGRVGLVLSDNLWLWARGWKGGGPQTELVRRLAHWLMEEPELEEEALDARVENATLRIERRTIKAGNENPALPPPQASVIAPDGTRQMVPLRTTAPGRERASLPIDQPGLWQISDGSLTAAAAAPDPDPLEHGAVVATDSALGPYATATGGGVFWLADGATDRNGVPRLKQVESTGHGVGTREPLRAARATGDASSWMGLRKNNATITLGYQQTPLIPGPLAALLVLAAVMIVWRQEGR